MGPDEALLWVCLAASFGFVLGWWRRQATSECGYISLAEATLGWVLAAATIGCFLVTLFSFISAASGVPLGSQDRASGIVAFFAYWLLLPTMVFLDARNRRGRAWAWALMVLCTNLLGLIGYLIVRPEKPRECRRCGYRLREDFVVCPYCGPHAGRLCMECQATLEPDWRYCPYCQTDAAAPSHASAPGTSGPSNGGPLTPTSGSRSAPTG